MLRRLGILLLLSFVGCSTTVEFFPMNRPSDSVRAAQIEVLTKRPERDYVEVGLIRVKRGPLADPWPHEMMHKLKKKAWEVGADAVILEGLSAGLQMRSDGSSERPLLTSSKSDEITALAISMEIMEHTFVNVAFRNPDAAGEI